MRMSRSLSVTLATGAALCWCSTVAYSQHRPSRTLEFRQHAAVAAMLHAMPWRTLCPSGDPCPIVQLDTNVYAVWRPYMTPGTDSVALVLSSAFVESVHLERRSLLRSGPSRGDVVARDTVLVSLALLVGKGTSIVRPHVIAQVKVPNSTFGYWVHGQLVWTSNAFKVAKVWLVEE